MAKSNATATTMLKDSAYKVWLAGLGALSTAEAEGTKMFNGLVKKGEKYEKTMSTDVGKATKKVRTRANKVMDKAEKAFDKVTDTFDDKVGAALGRLGVPSKSEIRTLTRKVDRLTKAIEDMTPKKKTTRKRTTRKAARKTA